MMRRRKELDTSVAWAIGLTVVIVHWYLRASPIIEIACGIAAFFVYRGVAYLFTRIYPETAEIGNNGRYDDNDGGAPKSLSIRQMCWITAAFLAIVIFNAIVGRGAQVGGQEWWLSIATATGSLARLWYTAVRDHTASPLTYKPDAASESS
jgi:hypothetical protein